MPQLQQAQREDRDEEDHAEDVELSHGTRGPERQGPPQHPPALGAARVRLPRGGECQNGEERDRVGVPDERRFVDRGWGHGEQQAGDGTGRGAADGAREPPRERDRGNPEQCQEGRDRDRVAVRERRRRREQEVVERPVVELADGRLGAQQRHEPVAGEGDKRAHVVALVGIEAAAGVDPRQAQERRECGDGEQGQPIEAAHLPGAHPGRAGDCGVSWGRSGGVARPSCNRPQGPARSAHSHPRLGDTELRRARFRR